MRKTEAQVIKIALFIAVMAAHMTSLEASSYSSNQAVVSNQLQSINNLTAEESTLVLTIAGLPEAEAESILDQLSGEQYTHAIFAATLANQQFIKRLYTPLRDILTADPELVDANYDTCNDSLTDIWLDGGCNRCFVNGSQSAKGYKATGYAYTLGAQLTFNRDWTAGTAISYENQRVDYNLDGASRHRYFLGGVYAIYRPEAYYLLGDLAFSYGTQKFKRRINAGTLSYQLHGHPKTCQGTIYLEGGKDYVFGIMLAQPFIGVEAGYLRRTAVNEHSDYSPLADLSIKKGSFGATYSCLGVHFSTQRFSRLALALDLAWRCRLTPLDNCLRANFQNFGQEFTVKGVNNIRNNLEGAISLSGKVIEDIELFVEATCQWWPRAIGYNVFGGMMFSW